MVHAKGLSLRLAGVLLLSLVFALSLRAQVKTTIADSIHAPDGSAVTGKITIRAHQTFTAADGTVVTQASKYEVKLAADGSFSIALVPTLGGLPVNSYYDVQYTTSEARAPETWVVPVSGTPVDLLAVRAMPAPIPSIVIPLAQVVAPNCADGESPKYVDPPGQLVCGELNIGTVNMNLESPTTADAGKFEWKPANALTLKRISCSTDNGTADVNLDIRQEATPNAGGNQVLSAPLTCTTTTGSTSAIANPNVGKDTPVALLVTATNGQVSVVRIHVEYKLSP